MTKPAFFVCKQCHVELRAEDPKTGGEVVRIESDAGEGIWYGCPCFGKRLNEEIPPAFNNHLDPVYVVRMLVANFENEAQKNAKLELQIVELRDLVEKMARRCHQAAAQVNGLTDEVTRLRTKETQFKFKEGNYLGLLNTASEILKSVFFEGVKDPERASELGERAIRFLDNAEKAFKNSGLQPSPSKEKEPA